MRFFFFLITFLGCVVAVRAVSAVEYLTVRRGDQSLYLSGKVVVEASDGGLLLQSADGVMWMVQREEIVKRDRDDKPFELLDKDGLADQLLKEMPDGFQIHHTAHYVICYNTSAAYAQWCGALYERLYRGFYGYWRNRGLRLDDPPMPLVALVFDSQKSYADYARAELGGATESIIGYYSFQSNRVIMYDLTGIEKLNLGQRPRTSAHVNLLLSQAGAERTVATIVHEATHQLAFNCGLQIRFADNPLWLSEGLAVYFETPDLNSSKGWRTIGGVSGFRLSQFGKYLVDRPDDSLTTLLVDDKRFRDADKRLDAYAEAWALNYFLIRSRPKEYVEYLKLLGAKKPFVFDEPQERLADFKAAFGPDLDQLDADFLRAMRSLADRR